MEIENVGVGEGSSSRIKPGNIYPGAIGPEGPPDSGVFVGFLVFPGTAVSTTGAGGGGGAAIIARVAGIQFAETTLFEIQP